MMNKSIELTLPDVVKENINENEMVTIDSDGESRTEAENLINQNEINLTIEMLNDFSNQLYEFMYELDTTPVSKVHYIKRISFWVAPPVLILTGIVSAKEIYKYSGDKTLRQYLGSNGHVDNFDIIDIIISLVAIITTVTFIRVLLECPMTSNSDRINMYKDSILLEKHQKSLNNLLSILEDMADHLNRNSQFHQKIQTLYQELNTPSAKVGNILDSLQTIHSVFASLTHDLKSPQNQAPPLVLKFSKHVQFFPLAEMETPHLDEVSVNISIHQNEEENKALITNSPKNNYMTISNV